MTEPGQVLFQLLARLPSGQIADEWLETPGLALAAGRHGVAAWVLDGLQGRTLPGALRDELTTWARQDFGKATNTRRLTIKVLDALGRQGVTPVMLKGSALASRIYPGNPLVRPSTDVDVLVPPEALDAAGHALGGLGLSRFTDTASADPLDDHHHLSFTGPGQLVEVHFRLTNTFGGGLFDDERVRSRTMPYRFEGRPALVLAPEDEFLYLATHAANHAFLRAGWLVDLQQYLRHGLPLDFDVMAVRAADAGFTTPVTVALSLLERLLEVSLPAAARRAFPHRPARRALDALLFSPARVASASLASHRLGSFVLRLWMVDSAGHGVKHVADGVLRSVRRAWAAR